MLRALGFSAVLQLKKGLFCDFPTLFSGPLSPQARPGSSSLIQQQAPGVASHSGITVRG